MTYSKETMKEIYRSLPDELEAIVATQETSAINDEIAKIHGLDKQQRLELGDEVTMRLLGITSKEAFPANLESRLKINSDIAQKIADDVKNKILSKISEKILMAQEEYVQVKMSIPTEEPVIITQENKQDALKNLSQRVANNQKVEAAAVENNHANLPMVEPAFAQGSVMVKKGEVAHNVAPATSEVGSKNQEVRMGETEKPKMPTPTVHYPGGQDPYREPLV